MDKPGLTLEDLTSEIAAEYRYFQTTRPMEHRRDSWRRLRNNVQMLTQYVDLLNPDAWDEKAKEELKDKWGDV